MTIVEGTRSITGGVDTHLDVHVAAALDDIGGLLGVESFEATAAGNTKLHDWLASFGSIARVGIEGTGSYGAGLARSLRSAGVEVVEVDRPNRQGGEDHVAHERGLAGSGRSGDGGEAADREPAVEAVEVAGSRPEGGRG